MVTFPRVLTTSLGTIVIASGLLSVGAATALASPATDLKVTTNHHDGSCHWMMPEPQPFEDKHNYIPYTCPW